jgi:hypothetical protein
MRKVFVYLSLIGLLITINQKSLFANSDFEFPVEVIEVRDLGLSDRDEAKSLIEVSWQSDRVQKDKISNFNVSLFITYADGTRLVEKQKFNKDIFSARIEIPSVKTFHGKSSAFIKKLDARVTAAIIKN